MLVDPVRLGPADGPGITAPTRLVFGPHETNLSEPTAAAGRTIGERHVTYYERRARGGAGLVVTETASVHPLDWPYERSPLAARCGAGWEAVGAACHAHGVPVLAGLGHAGLQGSSAFSQRETWAPSPVPDAITRELPKEMEAADIAEVLQGFADGARLAVTAGLDGVEINAGQHSLVRQFLSGLTNMRGDEWGPDANGQRLRFLTEVLRVVRAAVGDRLLSLRLSCDELAPWAGLTPELAEDVVRAVADDVDLLVVVRGSIFSVDATRPDAHEPAGFNLDLAGRMRRVADGRCLVVAQGSIVDPGQAEWALTDDEPRADLVEMTRAQIADPDLGAKVAGRVAGAVRPCIRCNQRCRVRDNRNPVVTCTVNPSAGHETIDPEAPRHPQPPTALVVVGAGPAGLETARVAATAGVDVTVVDARDETCATVRDFAGAAGREPFTEIADWLTDECERLGVTFEFGRTVTPDDVDAWRDAGVPVVVATGGRARPLDFAAGDDAVVMRGQDWLAARRAGAGVDLPDGPVLVWDPVGGPIAISIAETLAHEGRAVDFVCPDVTAGTLLSLTGDLAAASTRLLQGGVTIHRHSVLERASGGTATIVDRFTDRRTGLDAAVVIDAATLLPDDELWHAADGAVSMVGDAVAPRTVFEAVLEGRRAAIAALEGRTVAAGLGSAMASGFEPVAVHR